MSIRQVRRLSATAAVMLVAALVHPISAVAEDDGYYAEFEGETIDLTEDWGEAQACIVTDEGTTCYRSEAEMDAANPPSGGISFQALGLSVNLDVVALAACSSSLRLYDGTSYGGSMINVTTRGTLVSLAGWFDNVTSSYKVGACAATLYSGYGSGPYPGPTWAGAQAPSMQAGWNNVISSVYLY